MHLQPSTHLTKGKVTKHLHPSHLTKERLHYSHPLTWQRKSYKAPPSTHLTKGKVTKHLHPSHLTKERLQCTYSHPLTWQRKSYKAPPSFHLKKLKLQSTFIHPLTWQRIGYKTPPSILSLGKGKVTMHLQQSTHFTKERLQCTSIHLT